MWVGPEERATLNTDEAESLEELKMQKKNQNYSKHSIQNNNNNF